MNKWKPIKTAPKNSEKRVMLYGKVKYGKNITSTFNKYIHIGFYEPNKLYPKFDWLIMFHGKDEMRLNATHWQQLPLKPKSK